MVVNGTDRHGLRFFIVHDRIIILTVDNNVIAEGSLVFGEVCRERLAGYVELTAELVHTFNTIVKLSIAVAIYKLNVAGAKGEGRVCEIILVCNARTIYPLSFLIFTVEVGNLEEAVEFETPDIAVVLSFIKAIATGSGNIGVQHAVLIVPLGDFAASVADSECCPYVGIAERVIPVDCEFPAIGTHCAAVGQGYRSPED